MLISGNSTNIVSTDKATGLLKVKPGSNILLADGSTQQVQDNYFVHPQTGRILPIQGNVCFDPIKSRLVCVVDSASGTYLRNKLLTKQRLLSKQHN